MNDLVFLNPNKIDAIPFTTSDVIAEFSGVGHKKIKEALSKHKSVIETFGLLAPYETESTGGRPEVIYRLNEQQATFLMTLLKNTPVVVEFKRLLVESFYEMRSELRKREMLRIQLKPIRRELTDIIKEVSDDPWMYKHATDLAYKSVTGRNAAQLRADRNAPKGAVAVDYMTADEIEAITKLESRIGVLLEMGLDYFQIKALVLTRQMIAKAG